MPDILRQSTAPPLTIVTGGAGFLGSHLCDRLIAEGHEVLCLDNLLTGRIENIQHVWDHPRFAFVLYDVTQSMDLDDLLLRAAPKLARNGGPSRNRPDYILHFASPASPKDYARHPIPHPEAWLAGRLSRARDGQEIRQCRPACVHVGGLW
jgi:dTDP-glucose 4,6-dehydratase